ncbi:haloacid dehalogenase [Desulfomarina profundi]|uniref:Haloacid dehalogenase n=1 Tax=Desulfomarina profundi TaxID=2772557 RepID=A0A8D5JTK3_9BACT|nr:HAD hydrolase-like protein [Desulfomarina profundi]BCL63276.1 haloacid dehalogenase [Desulfomarina profundi]
MKILEQPFEKKPTLFHWHEIETVFLDLDGTLLDRYFDDYFWNEYVPRVFAGKNNLDLATARRQLLATYKSVENTLLWTDLDHWSAKLDLNIPMLKKEVSHLIAIHPGVIDFLDHLTTLEKKIFLVTNAHPKTLDVKLDKVALKGYFQAVFSSNDVGAPKERQRFWKTLETLLPFAKETTFFADDTEKVLFSARKFGIHHLCHIARPSSRLAPAFSDSFPSITDFSQLTPSREDLLI